PTPTHASALAVQSLTRADLYDALRAGLADFRRAPVYGLFFGAVFSLAGIAIAWALFVGNAGVWILPVAAGFPLIGPFAAVGLYEVSRRLEAGEPLAWAPVLGAGFRQRNSQLPFFAVFTVFVFLVWIVLARVIFAVSFGTATMTNVTSSFDILLSAEGLIMFGVGMAVGAVLSALLFSISVIGVPLLLDRDIDVVTAILTSLEATKQNREVMLSWGGVVALLVVIAMLPLFIGMVVVFPVLGHASWHVYRKTIASGTPG
ncbi:MAG: DUF2189 domain-containing protein, partial [Pseudomonadota bacterium]